MANPTATTFNFDNCPEIAENLANKPQNHRSANKPQPANKPQRAIKAPNHQDAVKAAIEGLKTKLNQDLLGHMKHLGYSFPARNLSEAEQETARKLAALAIEGAVIKVKEEYGNYPAIFDLIDSEAAAIKARIDAIITGSRQPVVSPPATEAKDASQAVPTPPVSPGNSADQRTNP